uniref:Cellulase n=1 Tax=uncultured marine virus TaxID=186617 RepID=A0A0F7L526_9VIRU|nr:cellulase [uncultured marine virus]
MRHPVARRVRAPGRRVVPALRHHLAQAEPDAGERDRPPDEVARVHLPDEQVGAVSLRCRRD